MRLQLVAPGIHYFVGLGHYVPARRLLVSRLTQMCVVNDKLVVW